MDKKYGIKRVRLGYMVEGLIKTALLDSFIREYKKGMLQQVRPRRINVQITEMNKVIKEVFPDKLHAIPLKEACQKAYRLRNQLSKIQLGDEIADDNFNNYFKTGCEILEQLASPMSKLDEDYMKSNMLAKETVDESIIQRDNGGATGFKPAQEVSIDDAIKNQVKVNVKNEKQLQGNYKEKDLDWIVKNVCEQRKKENKKERLLNLARDNLFKLKKSKHYKIGRNWTQSEQRNQLMCDAIFNEKRDIADGEKKVFLGYHGLFGWVAVKRCMFPREDKKKKSLECINHLSCDNAHHNVISYIATCENSEESLICYTITYLCEENLEQHIMSAAQKDDFHNTQQRLISELLRGLEFLHCANLVHRDLKPSNVLIDKHGTLKISDYGISREIDPEDTGTLTDWAGTVYWQHPKLIGETSVSVEMHHDIFSCTMLIFFILSTGKHPFRNGDEKITNRKYRHRLKHLKYQNKLEDATHQENIHSVFDNLLNHRKNITATDLKCSMTNNLKCLNLPPTIGARHALLVSITSTKEMPRSEDNVNVMMLTDDVRRLNLEYIDQPLLSANADVTVLKHSLERCKFNDKANTVTVCKNVDEDQLMEGIDEMLKKVKEEEGALLWFHISSHGYYDEEKDDTFLRLSNNNLTSVRTILQCFKNGNDNINLVITIDACRIYGHGNAAVSYMETPDKIAIMYSCLKGIGAFDTGSDDYGSGQFQYTPFCGKVAEHLIPGKKLKDCLQQAQIELESTFQEPDLSCNISDYVL